MVKKTKASEAATKKSRKNAQTIDKEQSPKVTADTAEITSFSKTSANDESILARLPIPNAFSLLLSSFKLLRENWQVLLGIAVVYTLFNVVLIQNLSTTASLSVLKHNLNQLPAHGLGHLLDGFSMYSYLLGATGNSISPVAGSYQFVLAIVVSLAVIWSLRQIYGGYTIRIRDGFYRGMYPLIPFLLVLLMIVVQLVPFIVGGSIFSIISANGISVNAGEQFMFLTLFFGLGFVSFYMLSSSLFALYIVSLPEMTPMAALRTARDLVAHRRWTIMRKLIFLPLALLVLSAVVLLPVVAVATVIAPWVFALVDAVVLVLVHIYIYRLYRSLL